MVTGNSRSKRRIRLTERDRFVLEHVALYALSVTDAIEQLPCFVGAGAHAAAGVRRRLLRGGFLGRQELGSDRYRYCYYLQDKARTVLDDPIRTGPLKDEPKIRAFALLAFCCLHKIKRDLLSKEEFQAVFPALSQPQRRVNYYIDTEGAKRRLAYVRVDFGRSDTVPIERLVGYCRRDIAKILAVPEALEIVRQDTLQLTVLTALAQKADMLRRALRELAEEEEAPPIPIRICHVPELRELIAPIRR